MITCQLMGGLGNQLFQIFTTISYAVKSKKPFIFQNSEELKFDNATVRYTYWKTFLKKLKPFITNIFPENITLLKETGFQYLPLDLPLEKVEPNLLPLLPLKKVETNICLFGYFQSYKYFEEYYDTICDLINLDFQKNEVIIKSGYTEDYLNKTISMHFRLGDYKKLPNHHPVLTDKYYKKCLRFFDNIKLLNLPLKKVEQNVLYFCEDDDLEDVTITINTLQKKFPTYTFIRASNLLQDWEQMLLMSCCAHNIIANSSFSWWGAYFNLNPEKIVCYPDVWFGPACNHNTSDLFPPSWYKIHF